MAANTRDAERAADTPAAIASLIRTCLRYAGKRTSNQRISSIPHLCLGRPALSRRTMRDRTARSSVYVRGHAFGFRAKAELRGPSRTGKVRARTPLAGDAPMMTIDSDAHVIE